MNTITTLSKTTKKYLAIIQSGKIEERELIALKSFMNKSKENAKFVFDVMRDKELELSNEQDAKGIAFLLDQWKTPTGIERKNNPFGYREQAVLEDFSHFVVKDWYNAGNAYIDYYLPLYECVSHSGSSFEYYYNGKVNIVG